MRPNVTLPGINGNANQIIDGKNNIVITGGNGAGKTRIGAWIEFHQPGGTTVHRISAQRALNLPELAQMQTADAADRALFYGGVNSQPQHKASHRWGDKAETLMLSDYDKLLTSLFARSVKRNEEHTNATRAQGIFIEVPDSPIDTIIKVWPDIMPQNTITFADGKVTATNAHGNYPGREMSDGERVALYLLGQCLCAPENSIVIIDEPEIHLHRSLMGRLWNKIEEICPNKTFVYITHDLDFAASRNAATKIWIQSFATPAAWQWSVIPEVDDIPENLAIEILGNRKNILFCEGEKGGYDHIIFQAAFPAHHVIPRGGCDKVIESTKAMNGNAALHHLEAVGIIDADYRTTAELQALEEAHIHNIKVAEIENLFCVEPLLRIIATNQQHNPDTKVAEVTAFIIQALQDEFETQVSNHAEREIQYKLRAYTKAAHTEQGLADGLANLVATIDTGAIYAASRALFQEAIDENSLEKALRIYNRKRLANRISPIFGLTNGEYINIILRLLKTNAKSSIIAAFQPYMPAI